MWLFIFVVVSFTMLVYFIKTSDERVVLHITIHVIWFVCLTAGDHKAVIMFNGMEIPNSPFTIKVYHVSHVKVKDIPVGIVGVPATFIGKCVIYTKMMISL